MQGDIPNRGWLRNGNPPGNPNNAPRCLAKTRRGTPCQRATSINKQTGRRLRCPLHGSKATGPRTPEGRARCAAARTKHGRFTKQAIQQRRELRLELRRLKLDMKELEKAQNRRLRADRREREKEQKLQRPRREAPAVIVLPGVAG